MSYSHHTKQAMKMSTSKIPSSNRQLVSDEEVAISLERLIDSVVMKVTAQRSALQFQQVNVSNADALGIDSLPDEMIVEVFSYLTQNQLGQIARVCRRWGVLTKSPLLWRNVNVRFCSSYRCQTTVAKSFVNGLSSCATSIKLDFVECDDWIEPLCFEEFCLRLQAKCTNLKELILSVSVLSNSLSSVIGLCMQFLQDVKYLIFHYSKFFCCRSTDEYVGISKIEVLELLNCRLHCSSDFNSPFSKMPNLKQLHLRGTIVDDSWFEYDASFLSQLHVLNLGGAGITAEIFQAIQNHGLNLKEFYICGNWIQDHNLNFNNSVFPHLQTICLSCTNVTCETVVSLIRWCPSLVNVYVDEGVAESFAKHPFVVYSKCKSEIVKAIDPIHDHNIDYSEI